MCHSVTLHHNEHGYVTWCKHCDHISVAFGNSLMSVLPDQARVFIQLLEHDISHYQDKVSENEKAFIYNTDSQCIKLILNYREITQLGTLLLQSMLMYEVSRLLCED